MGYLKQISWFNVFVSVILIFGIIVGQLIKFPFPYGSGISILDISVSFLILIGLFSIKFKLKPMPFWIKSAFLVSLFFIFSLILSPLNLNLTEKLISFGYILRFSLYFLLGWVIYSGGFKKFSDSLNSSLILSGIILCFLAIIQLIFFPDLAFLTILGWDPHYFRAVSTFLDPNFLGSFLVLILIIFVVDFKNMNKFFKIWIFLFFYSIILFTFSRSVYGMLVLSFILLVFFTKSKKIFSLTIFIILGVIISYFSYFKQIAEPRNINKEQSAIYRLGSWQAGFSIFKRSPVFGIGYNSYRYALQEYGIFPKEIIQSHGGSSNDSSFLQVLSTSGIIGLLIYLFFLFSIFFTAYKNYKKGGRVIGIICFVGLTALLANSFFINSFFYPWPMLWLVLTSSQLKNYGIF